jgi:hypothetical protein
VPGAVFALAAISFAAKQIKGQRCQAAALAVNILC